jgi:hypothetical protein
LILLISLDRLVKWTCLESYRKARRIEFTTGCSDLHSTAGARRARAQSGAFIGQARIAMTYVPMPRLRKVA